MEGVVGSEVKGVVGLVEGVFCLVVEVVNVVEGMVDFLV